MNDADVQSLITVFNRSSVSSLSKSRAFGVETKAGYVEAGKSEAWALAAQIISETLKSTTDDK